VLTIYSQFNSNCDKLDKTTNMKKWHYNRGKYRRENRFLLLRQHAGIKRSR